MARPRKEPDYDPEKLQKELLTEAKEAYEHPLLNDADNSGHMKLNRLAEEFSITPVKARKLLITAGVYTTPISQRVQELKQNGRTLEEIQQLTGLSRASVHSYMPYSKVVYNMERLSLQAKQLHAYRERKATVEKLHMELASDRLTREAALWNAAQCFAEYPFHKATGDQFRYFVVQDDLHIEGTDYSISRAFLNFALSALVEDRDSRMVFHQHMLENSEKAQYLVPIFVRFGLLPSDSNEKTPLR